jgi:hypothetical protein
MRTIFRWICPVAAAKSEGRSNGRFLGLFFAANRRAHAISPPLAASRPDMMLSAGVAELVDALDLGSSDESCGGSSPSARTKRFQRLHDDLMANPILWEGIAEPPAQA